MGGMSRSGRITGRDSVRIVAVGPGLGRRAGDELDAGGRLVAPGFVNLHLFKRRYEPEEVAHRAARVLEAGVQSGTTFFRLFADVGPARRARTAALPRALS